MERAILVNSDAIENQPDNVGFLVNSRDIPLNSLNSFCDFIGDTLDDHRTRKTCSMTDSSTAGSLGEKEYRLVKFEVLGTWGDGSPFKDGYSVLFEIINANAKPFWLYKLIDDGSYLYDIKLLREGQYPVFEATYNSGGTRPAWHNYTIRRPSGFSIIDTEELEHAVFKIAEDNGYETRSTLYFDFMKHQASNGFYRPKDPNCCPSAGISLTFDIINDVMVLKNYKIEIK